MRPPPTFLPEHLHFNRLFCRFLMDHQIGMRSVFSSPWYVGEGGQQLAQISDPLGVRGPRLNHCFRLGGGALHLPRAHLLLHLPRELRVPRGCALGVESRRCVWVTATSVFRISLIIRLTFILASPFRLRRVSMHFGGGALHLPRRNILSYSICLVSFVY